MNRGYTLVETVVTIGIMIAALAAITTLYLTFYNMYFHEQAMVETTGSAGRTMTKLELAILPADQVVASYTTGGQTYISTTTSLVLSVPSVDASGNIVAGAKDYFVFATSSSTLYQRVFPNAASTRSAGTTTLSTSIKVFRLSYNATPIASSTGITATTTTEVVMKGVAVTQTVQEFLQLRNATGL